MYNEQEKPLTTLIFEIARNIDLKGNNPEYYLIEMLDALVQMNNCRINAEGSPESYLEQLNQLLPDGITAQNEFGVFSYLAADTLTKHV